MTVDFFVGLESAIDNGKVLQSKPVSFWVDLYKTIFRREPDKLEYTPWCEKLRMYTGEDFDTERELIVSASVFGFCLVATCESFPSAMEDIPKQELRAENTDLDAAVSDLCALPR